MGARCPAFLPPLPTHTWPPAADDLRPPYPQVLLEGTLQPVHKARDSREGITDLKYSPDGRYLAVATADAWVDVYSTAKGYQRTVRAQ